VDRKEGPNNRPDAGQQEDKRHWSRVVLATVATIAIAGATAFATGLGSKLADDVSASSKPLVSWSATEEVAGCGWNSEVFLPGRAATQARAMKPDPEDFPIFQRELEAAMVGTQRVNVSIQGESARPVTLLGIHFHVHRRPRPAGGVFVSPCGGPTVGRTVVFSLDSDPPKIVASNASLKQPLSTVEGGGTASHPIRFPWTVSLTDPLFLIMLGTLKSNCYCTWAAEIPWVSGGEKGVIQVDNGGEGFRMVGAEGGNDGLTMYSPGPDGEWMAGPAG
jgi:hypothetical protein